MLVFLLIFVVSIASSGQMFSGNDNNVAYGMEIDKKIKDAYDGAKEYVKKKADDVKETVTSKPKEQKANKSYASYLFDESDKNQSVMYFNSQTNADVKTVESIINDKGNGDGTEYASFLYTLNKWNLYNSYDNQLDSGIGAITKGLKAIFGSLLLGCLYLMDGIDTLIYFIADLVGHLNIFKYMVDGQGEIPKSNPLSVLQPLVDLFKNISLLAKIFLIIFLGYILFRVASGFGRARNRGSYFGRGFLRVSLGWLSIACVPLVASAFFGIFSSTVKSIGDQDGFVSNQVKDIPTGRIVDTKSYIDGSLTQLKGKSNQEAVQGGFVLEHKKFPKTKHEADTQIPTPSFVNYYNTGGISKETPDGKELLTKWIKSSTYTADDIDTMYGLSKEDKSNPWALWENDEKRAYQFKMSYQDETVKLFSGKDAFSLDLSGVTIQSAALAGNGGLGVFLNFLDMATLILGITFVTIILVFSLILALSKSVFTVPAYAIRSAFGSPQALLGLCGAMIMVVVSTFISLVLIKLFPSLTIEISNNISEYTNKSSNLGAIAKQVVVSCALLIGMFFSALFTFKGRKAFMGVLQDFFTNAMERIGMEAGLRGENQGSKALSDINNADQKANQFGIDAMNKPLDKSRDALKNGANMAVGYGLGKMADASESIKEKGKDVGKAGAEKAKEAAANFRSKFTTDEELNDADLQGNDIKSAVDDSLAQMGSGNSSSIASKLNDQDNALTNAIKSQNGLANAEKELQNAKDHYDKLKNSGASESELNQAQEAINQAQTKYDNAAADFQKNARDMALTGATAQSIADAKKSSATDYSKATNDINQAQNDLKALQKERQQLVRAGASDRDLVGIDKEILDTENRLATAKDQQAFAKQAYEASVGNAQKEKDLRNDYISSRQGVREATQNLASAKRSGNLTPQQLQTFRNTANAMSNEISALSNATHQELQESEIASGALNFMQGNMNKAFTDDDLKNVNNYANSVGDRVKKAQAQYEQAKSNKASKSEIANFRDQYLQANKLNAGTQAVKSAIESGRATDEAITAQKQIVEAVMSEKEQASQQVENLQEQVGNGISVSRSAMQSAKANYNQASSAAMTANKTLMGLYAMKAAGKNHLSSNDLDLAKERVGLNIKDQKKKANTLTNAQKIIEDVNKGGNVNKDNVYNLTAAQKIAQEEATQKVDAAASYYDTTSAKLADLKNQLSAGKPVSVEVKRLQNTVDQAKQAFTKAQNHRQAIISSGATFKSTGRSILNNVKIAEEQLVEKQRISKDRGQAYDDLLKTGGYTQEQLSKLQKEVSNSQSDMNSKNPNFKREYREKVFNIQSDFDKAEAIMKK
ncbi:hypothetical protein [Staphylococcus hyicus]|uniref:hypothetical protein n=1 Tax=Staphylococcus hyicus TaxID=1284 RepID=UPI003132B6CA